MYVCMCVCVYGGKRLWLNDSDLEALLVTEG